MAIDMMSDVVQKVVQKLDQGMTEKSLGKPYLSSHNYRAKEFNRSFVKIINIVDSKRRLAFIDGGNQELVGAPNFSIQVNRVCFSLFEGRKRIHDENIPHKIEFFSATFAVFKDEKIFYETSIFPVSSTFSALVPNEDDLSFDSTDRRLMVGTARADIARVASIARRFAEWTFARQVVANWLEEGDVLVMDGTLRTAFRNESKYAKEAYRIAKSKGVIYSGFAKTSRLLTTTGLSLIGAVQKLAADAKAGPIWSYHPIAESLTVEHEGSIFIVKLNENSNRIYRYEIQAEQSKQLKADQLNEVLSQIALNSADASFPGYPYGLMDVDANARVRYDEVETYRIMFLSEISKMGSWQKFLRHMQADDAHTVLNGLRGA